MVTTTMNNRFNLIENFTTIFNRRSGESAPDVADDSRSANIISRLKKFFSPKERRINRTRRMYLDILNEYAGKRIGEGFMASNLSRSIARCARASAFSSAVDLPIRSDVYNSNSIALLIHGSVGWILMGSSNDEIFTHYADLEPFSIWIRYFDQDIYEMLARLRVVVLLAASTVVDDDFLKVYDILVGIEPNPGPNSRERKARASARKRALCLAEVLAQKEKDRMIELQLRDERRRKLDQIYQAEGLFEVGLDSESKGFLQQLIDRVSVEFKELHIIHDHHLSPPEFLVSILTWFKTTTGAVRDLFFSFIRLFVYVLPKKVVEFYNGVCSLIFPKAVVPSEGFYECEMGVPVNSFFAALYSGSLKEAIDQRSWEKFITTVMEIKKSVGLNTGALTYASTLLREIITFLNDSFSLQIPNFLEPTELKDLFAKCDRIKAEFRAGVISEYDFADRVFMIQDEIESQLYNKRQILDPVLKDRLQYMLRRFQPIVQYCERNINPNNGPRIEPLAMLIAGPSGVGKSTITVPFLLSLMGNILPADKKADFMKNHNDFMFFRANENEYWDGYKMRNVAVIYDDFGQQKDTAGNPNPDAFEIIRLKNTAPYHLHYAGIEDKQRNFAAPKLIFATTNRNRLHFESIISNEAVIRRFDLAFVQVPKIEYCVPSYDSSPFSRKLDLDKVRKEFPFEESKPETFAELSVMEFIEWDFLVGAPRMNGRVLDFNGLLKLAISKFKELSTKGDAMLRFHEFMKTYSPEGDVFVDAPEKSLSDRLHDLLDSLIELGDGKYMPSPIMSMGARRLDSIFGSFNRGSFLKIIGLVAGAAVAVYGAIQASKALGTFLFGSGFHDESNFTKNQGKAVKRVVQKGKNTRSVKRAMVRVAKSTPRMHAEAAVPDLTPYLSLMRRSMYLVEVRGKCLGFCLFFYKRHFMWPRHFTDYIMNLDEIEESDGDWTEIINFIHPITRRVVFALDFNKDIDYWNLQKDVDMSLCYVQSDKIRSHTDLLSKFGTFDAVSRLDASYDAQMMVDRNETLVALATKVILSSEVEYSMGDITYKSRGLHYSAPTSNGDCGSLILAHDSRLQRPTILGIHTAGSTPGVMRVKNCAGVVVFREELESFIADTGCDGVAFTEEDIVEMIPETAEIEGFNSLCQKQTPRMPTETKIVQSPMAPMLWEPTTKPAHLRSFRNEQGELLNPYKLARAGYVHDEVFIDYDALKKAEHYVANLILNHTKEQPHKPRVFTYEESICGIPGVEFVESINRSTSAGYPYILQTKKKGKTEWFGTGSEFDLSTPKAKELRGKVDNILDSAKEGKRLTHIFVDVLKDERRPIAKADAGKTRQIMTCPMDYLIATKMYFGDFIRFVCDTRIHNGIAVGVNPYAEWGNLRDFMQVTPAHVYTAGDYSKYDAKIPVSIGLSCLHIIESFYAGCDEEDTRIREVLFQEIINSRHLSLGTVYEFVGGNPSGQPLTAVYNSVCNLLILVYNAVLVTRSTGLDFDLVMSRTRMQVFGDDNIISYHPDDADVWSQQILERTIPLNVGMSYTNEAKDGKEVSARPIEAISFLKRSFRYDDAKWQCPLELSVLKETLSWMKKDSVREEMILRIEGTLSELARHGRGIFQMHAPKIVQASLKAYDYFPLNGDYFVALRSDMSLTD